MEYPEELSRQARGGIILGVVILIVGLLFGPSATVSKDDFTQLKAQVDEINKNVTAAQADVKATQSKVNGYEAPINEVKGKLVTLDEKIASLEQALGKISTDLQDALAKVNDLSSKAQVDQLQKTIARFEASFSEKFQVSVVIGDAPPDATGKPSCPQPYLAAQLLSESDVARLREMGVDKNGDGIVCILPTLVLPIELMQSTSESSSHN